MSKIVILGSFLFWLGSSNLLAQHPTNHPVSIQEMMTPSKPADGRPYVFYSQSDMDAAKEKKIASIKEDIRKNHDNPERIQAMREKLWRIENAVVQELPK